MQITLPRLLALVVGLWLAAPLLLWLFLPTFEHRGQFGDLFGSVNALFSGLAFAGLFWNLTTQQEQLELQRKELALQREELRLQREEMAASRAELAGQARAQEALFRASAAQIAVAAFQAEIEAIKLEAEEMNPGFRREPIMKIRQVASSLSRLSDRIEGSSSAA